MRNLRIESFQVYSVAFSSNAEPIASTSCSRVRSEQVGPRRRESVDRPSLSWYRQGQAEARAGQRSDGSLHPQAGRAYLRDALAIACIVVPRLILPCASLPASSSPSAVCRTFTDTHSDGVILKTKCFEWKKRIFPKKLRNTLGMSFFTFVKNVHTLVRFVEFS